MKKILFFFGTRPEAIKMAPVVEAFQADRRFKTIVGVSAQHRSLLDQVLKIFGLKVDFDLDIMREKQSLFDITSRVLNKFEPVLQKYKPDLVMVHGDTTTTLAGALASYYKRIPIGHVEAGLRTGDKCRPYPEEMNRHLTDALTTLHFAPTPLGRKCLLEESIDPKYIFVTGNTVIDALVETVQKELPFKNPYLRRVVGPLISAGKDIVLLTAHRRENFGRPFNNAFSALAFLGTRFQNAHWFYPVHPNPNVFGPAHRFFKGKRNFHLLPPIGYSDMVNLMEKSSLVVTDSGGLQEEAPSLGKPVLVLREVTERPEAVGAGTVRLVGTDKKKIISEVSRLLTNRSSYLKMANAVNPYGDGKASERILRATQWYFKMAASKPAPFQKKP